MRGAVRRPPGHPPAAARVCHAAVSCISSFHVAQDDQREIVRFDMHGRSVTGASVGGGRRSLELELELVRASLDSG